MRSNVESEDGDLEDRSMTARQTKSAGDRANRIIHHNDNSLRASVCTRRLRDKMAARPCWSPGFPAQSMCRTVPPKLPSALTTYGHKFPTTEISPYPLLVE